MMKNGPPVAKEKAPSSFKDRAETPAPGRFTKCHNRGLFQSHAGFIASAQFPDNKTLQVHHTESGVATPC